MNSEPITFEIAAAETIEPEIIQLRRENAQLREWLAALGWHVDETEKEER